MFRKRKSDFPQPAIRPPLSRLMTAEEEANLALTSNRNLKESYRHIDDLKNEGCTKIYNNFNKLTTEEMKKKIYKVYTKSSERSEVYNVECLLNWLEGFDIKMLPDPHDKEYSIDSIHIFMSNSNSANSFIAMMKADNEKDYENQRQDIDSDSDDDSDSGVKLKEDHEEEEFEKNLLISLYMASKNCDPDYITRRVDGLGARNKNSRKHKMTKRKQSRSKKSLKSRRYRKVSKTSRQSRKKK